MRLGVLLGVLLSVTPAFAQQGRVSVPNGADVAQGSTTDAAVCDSSATLNAHARCTAAKLASLDTKIPSAVSGGVPMTIVKSNLSAAIPTPIASLTNTAQTVAASAATLDSYVCYNASNALAYIQVFDIVGAVTVGSSTPSWSIPIVTLTVGQLSGMNLKFTNAIKVAATTTPAGGSAPSSALVCNFGSY